MGVLDIAFGCPHHGIVWPHSERPRRGGRYRLKTSAPNLNLSCLSGDGGGAHVGKNFTQGPNSSAIFRSCRAGQDGALAAACQRERVGSLPTPTPSSCWAWPYSCQFEP